MGKCFFCNNIAYVQPVDLNIKDVVLSGEICLECSRRFMKNYKEQDETKNRDS